LGIGVKGNMNKIPNPVAIDHYIRRIFFNQAAFNTIDHEK